MKVLVQDCKSLLYLDWDGRWVPQVRDAKQFSSGAIAIEFCSQYRIPRAQVVLKFPQPKDDIKLPVSQECRESA
jgi:hypothetical protein